MLQDRNLNKKPKTDLNSVNNVCIIWWLCHRNIKVLQIEIPTKMQQLILVLIYLIFFLSGSAALIYYPQQQRESKNIFC